MANPWDFTTPIWYTNCTNYPDFVGSLCTTNKTWAAMSGDTFEQVASPTTTWLQLPITTENCV